MRELLPFIPGSRAEIVRWTRKFTMRLQTLGHRTAQARLLLPKPRLLHVWFSTARQAQVCLGLTLFLLVFVAPPTVRALSDYLYPAVVSERRLLGIFERTRVLPNPLSDTRYVQFMAGLWTVGMGLVLTLLINHIPGAIAIGRERAARLREQADKLGQNDPEKSAQLRKDAMGLLIDSPCKSGTDSLGVAAPVSGTTKVISASDKPDQALRYVGVDRRYRLDRAWSSGPWTRT